jgi:hypothetical protein
MNISDDCKSVNYAISSFFAVEKSFLSFYQSFFLLFKSVAYFLKKMEIFSQYSDEIDLIIYS